MKQKIMVTFEIEMDVPEDWNESTVEARIDWLIQGNSEFEEKMAEAVPVDAK